MSRAFSSPTRSEYDVLFAQSRGGGLDDIRVFIPPHSGRVSGIFSVLSGFAKKAIPFLARTLFLSRFKWGRGFYQTY